MEKPLIGLLDCNNFFVSCERLFRPELKDRPVVVLSSNDGCVVARSKEIKDMGVPMGVPYFQIKDTLKKVDAVTFSSHFALYRDISRRVFSVMKDELGLVEQYSIDEAFFVVKEDPERLVQELKEVVERRVGIPVSIGVARTKTQAKYANSLAKKGNGIYVLNDTDWSERMVTVKLSEIWGVGGKTELAFKRHGLETVRDLLSSDKATITKVFGVSGVRLQQELAGNPVYVVSKKTEPQQSVLSSRSFSEATTNIAVLHDSIAYHVRHVTANMRAMNMSANRIRVSIMPSRHSDFVLRGGSKEAVLTAPTNDSMILLKVASQLLEELFEADVPYKKAGVTLLGLCESEIGQETLFNYEKKEENTVLMSVLDSLNKKIKKESVVIGSRLLNSAWQSKSEVRSPAYTTKWSDVAVVKAN